MMFFYSYYKNLNVLFYISTTQKEQLNQKNLLKLSKQSFQNILTILDSNLILKHFK